MLGLGFRVLGVGCRVWGLGFWTWDLVPCVPTTKQQTRASEGFRGEGGGVVFSDLAPCTFLRGSHPKP